jgi:hypothetical protein
MAVLQRKEPLPPSFTLHARAHTHSTMPARSKSPGALRAEAAQAAQRQAAAAFTWSPPASSPVIRAPARSATPKQVGAARAAQAAQAAAALAASRSPSPAPLSSSKKPAAAAPARSGSVQRPVAQAQAQQPLLMSPGASAPAVALADPRRPTPNQRKKPVHSSPAPSALPAREAPSIPAPPAEPGCCARAGAKLAAVRSRITERLLRLLQLAFLLSVASFLLVSSLEHILKKELVNSDLLGNAACEPLSAEAGAALVRISGSSSSSSSALAVGSSLGRASECAWSPFTATGGSALQAFRFTVLSPAVATEGLLSVVVGSAAAARFSGLMEGAMLLGFVGAALMT